MQKPRKHVITLLVGADTCNVFAVADFADVSFVVEIESTLSTFNGLLAMAIASNP